MAITRPLSEGESTNRKLQFGRDIKLCVTCCRHVFSNTPSTLLSPVFRLSWLLWISLSLVPRGSCGSWMTTTPPRVSATPGARITRWSYWDILTRYIFFSNVNQVIFCASKHKTVTTENEYLENKFQQSSNVLPGLQKLWRLGQFYSLQTVIYRPIYVIYYRQVVRGDRGRGNSRRTC